MRVFRSIASGFAAALTVVALVQPAAAAQFTWNQNGGFFFPGAGAVDGSNGNTGTLRAGQFHGADLAPLAAHGGLEFSGLQTSVNSPANTYSVIQWGCVPDGNNDPGVTNCVNAGGLANINQAGENLPLPAGRSALTLEVFDSNASGVLDSGTQNVVVIARINHLTRPIDNEANALAKIEVRANLVIDATPQVIDANTVPIGFLETNNIGTCPAPNPLGSQCDDLFTFDTSEFANVPFTSGGEDFFIQFGIAPVPECDDPTPTQVGSITIFDCTDVAGHRVAIDFTNGRAWAQEGFDSGFLITMFLTEEPINVPAPAALSLVGLGLVTVGLAAWRKGKKAAA